MKRISVIGKIAIEKWLKSNLRGFSGTLEKDTQAAEICLNSYVSCAEIKLNNSGYKIIRIASFYAKSQNSSLEFSLEDAHIEETL